MEPLLKCEDNMDHCSTGSASATVGGGSASVMNNGNGNPISVGIPKIGGSYNYGNGKWILASLPPQFNPLSASQTNNCNNFGNCNVSGGSEASCSSSSSSTLQYVPLSSPQGASSAGSGASQKSFAFCRICHEGDTSSSGNCLGGSPLSYSSGGDASSPGSNNRSPRDRESLIAPCHCIGSVALVHLSCLEHWLTISNSDKCELCHFVYKTKKIPRTWTEFLTESDNQFNVRNMIADLICFFLLTPLLVISTYLCCIGAHEYYIRERWEAVGLVTLSIFLLMVYFTWCQVTLKYHIGVWTTWGRTHQRIRITFGDGSTGQFNRMGRVDSSSLAAAQVYHQHRQQQQQQQQQQPPIHSHQPHSLINHNFNTFLEF